MAAVIDVNIAFALMHDQHEHHARALGWLDIKEAAGSILVCRVAQMGALRLLTSPKVMREEVLSADECWAGWARLMRDDRFALTAEPSSIEATWQDLTAEFPRGRSVDTDTYLAAFAKAGGWAMATFDQGFHRFAGLRVEMPV